MFPIICMFLALVNGHVMCAVGFFLCWMWQDVPAGRFK